MIEEIHAFLGQLVQNLTGLGFVGFEALVLAHHPCPELQVDVPEKRLQKRKTTVGFVITITPPARYKHGVALVEVEFELPSAHKMRNLKCDPATLVQR